MQLKRFLLVTLAVALAAASSGGVHGEDSIKGPIRILLGFADDASYNTAHLIGETITAAVDQPVVVERKPGATGRIAAEALKYATPDGTTLLLAPIVVPVLAPLVFTDNHFDPAKDFAPITQVATFRYAWAVSPNHPAHNVAEFVAWAKANPARANFGTGGPGSIPHFLGVMVGQATGIEMIHVPYKGAAPMSADLMGNQLVSGFDALANLIELHRAGRLRIIATTGSDRSSLLPEMPTFMEQGFPTVDATGWIALFAPAGTPKGTIDRLSMIVVKALHTPALRARILGFGGEPTGTTPEELAAIMVADTARWRPIIKASGFVAQ